MKFYKKGEEPMNPRPGSYVLVTTKEGTYWRLKRGTIRKATVNSAFTESIQRMKKSAPAASNIMRKLQPYMNGLDTGRLNAKISAILRKSLQEEGSILLRCLNGFDFQKDNPMHRLLQEDMQVQQMQQEVIVTIPIHAKTVKKLNTLVTNYYFELILLYGKAEEEYGLRTESVDSAVYTIGTNHNTPCVLRLVLPDEPWMALLKINSFEGNEPSAHPKLYGLKVVAAG